MQKAQRNRWTRNDPAHYKAHTAGIDAAIERYEELPGHLLRGRKAIALFIGLSDDRLKKRLAAGEFAGVIRKDGRDLVADPLEVWNAAALVRDQANASRAAGGRARKGARKRKRPGGCEVG